MNVLLESNRHRRKLLASFGQEKTPFLLSVLFSSLTVFLTVSAYTSLQPVIPLYYSLPQPEQQIVSKQFIVIVPLLSICVVIIHTLYAGILNRSDVIMTKTLNWFTVLITAFLLFIIMRILLII